MAEVKTYKCDICGEVYHRGEGEDHFMRIIHQPSDENSGKKFDYEFLCDDCIAEINKVIDNPSIINNLIIERSAEREHRHSIESCLDRIRIVFAFGGFPYTVWGGTKDKYEEMTKAFIEEYEDLTKSRTIWLRVSMVLVGVCLGLLACLIGG